MNQNIDYIKIVSPKSVHQYAKNHGWYENITRENVQPHQVLAWIALMHSELSEAVEAYRQDNMKNFGEELADVILRILDTAEFFNIDISREIFNKHLKNLERPYKHGKII